MLKEETDEDSRFQKWELEPESFISKKIRYKKSKKQWMKIKSLWSNSVMPGQEKYLEVSHCGKLLTIQGELITRKNHMNMYLLIFSKKIVVSLHFFHKSYKLAFLIQLNIRETDLDLLSQYLSHHLKWHCSSIHEDSHRFAYEYKNWSETVNKIIVLINAAIFANLHKS